MSCVDALGNRCTHRVRLHLRTVSAPAVSEALLITNAQRVYGGAGICVEVATRRALPLDVDHFRRLNVIDGRCQWNKVSDEQRELFAIGTEGVPASGVLVYFVQGIMLPGGMPLNGCAGHPEGRAAVLVSSRGSRWTMAHELGHVLLTSTFAPVHSHARDNLMFAPTEAIAADPPTLNVAQAAAIKRNRLLCPLC
jgi:hypothetical protein